jgi:DNA-binding transcriptional LysR family regulator
MDRGDLADLVAFIAVAQERSFTRAAAKLGVSQSALSQTIRGLETRLGVRLLTRTTRSVSPTDAGERLLATAAPRFEEVEAEMHAVAELRDKPTGTIRLTASEHAADSVLWPRLGTFLREHREVKVELHIDYGLSDIAAERFDMGVRLGDELEKDMVAVRIGPDQRFAVVGAPAYFDAHAQPRSPRDLIAHNCIGFRLPTYGGIYAWELERGKKSFKVRIDGQMVLNGLYQVVTAALEGVGLAFIPEDVARPYLAEGRLIQVLDEWCPLFPGFHLYYPSRRHHSRAMALLVEALRYRPHP